MSGGDRSKVKNVPFGSKTPTLSDYSHIKDYSTKLFAVQLGKDKKDPRKRAVVGGDVEEEENNEMDDEDGGSPTQKKKPQGKRQTAVDPDDLRAFLQEEGIDPDGENLCPLSKCMDNISKIILNDKNSKVERAEIMLEIEEINRQLQDSMKEEELATATLQALNKEQSGLENTVEVQREKAKALEQKREDLENEKKTFNGRVGVLEKDQRSWAAKLKVAQQKFAKVIWLKPGQKYDDDEGQLQVDIHHIKGTTKQDLDEISHPATVSYDRSADKYVTDYMEREKGPLYYSNYVEDSINRDSDLLSAATTSRLAFLERKKKVKRTMKSSGGGSGGGGARGEAETKSGRVSPVTFEDSATVLSQLTMDEGTVTSHVSTGSRLIQAPSVKSVHEYLTSGAARAMTRSPDKKGKGVGRNGRGGGGGGDYGGDQKVLLSSSQSVGGGTGREPPSTSPGPWKDLQTDLAAYNRSALVTSSMSRSGNKNPASIMGSPVKALQALKAAKDQLKRERANNTSLSHTRGRERASSPQHGGGVGADDDVGTIATVSTMANDASIFEMGSASQWIGGAHGDNGNSSFASVGGSASWEAGGAVGGSITSHNNKYGSHKDKGKLRTIVDGVGTLNYKSRTLKEMLEADEFE